jgi:hypothetical protein
MNMRDSDSESESATLMNLLLSSRAPYMSLMYDILDAQCPCYLFL